MKISGMQAMNDRQRLLFLILILAVVVLFTTGVTNYFLYNAAFEQNRKTLLVSAQSQVRLIEAFAKHEVEVDLEGKASLSDIVAMVNPHYPDDSRFCWSEPIASYIITAS